MNNNLAVSSSKEILETMDNCTKCGICHSFCPVANVTKEFPAQNGPGEAQEFYANVYNILGAPSLQVYIDTPREFNFQIESLSDKEGLLDFVLTDYDGVLVKNAVISVMNGSEILSKGLTNDSGRYIASLNIDEVNNVDIYANKGGFIILEQSCC